MKKTAIAVAAGLLLVAGQALASGQATTAPRVGDRVGVQSGEDSEFAGIPLIGIIAAAGVVAAAVVIVSGDDSDSD